MPDVPALAEALDLPGLEAVSWHVLFVRRDTPPAIVDRLHSEMKRIMETPEMQQRIANIGLIPNASPSVEGIQAYIKSETEKWGTLVRQLGLAGSQ
jgi:tripartite-type tricarboxylate transporter receptor subunit TctC